MAKKDVFNKTLIEMSELDLKARLQDYSLRLQKITFAHAMSPLENPMSIRSLRKDIARLKTQLQTKALA